MVPPVMSLQWGFQCLSRCALKPLSQAHSSVAVGQIFFKENSLLSLLAGWHPWSQLPGQSCQYNPHCSNAFYTVSGYKVWYAFSRICACINQDLFHYHPKVCLLSMGPLQLARQCSWFGLPKVYLFKVKLWHQWSWSLHYVQFSSFRKKLFHGIQELNHNRRICKKSMYEWLSG